MAWRSTLRLRALRMASTLVRGATGEYVISSMLLDEAM
jgi:hypothetical protein